MVGRFVGGPYFLSADETLSRGSCAALMRLLLLLLPQSHSKLCYIERAASAIRCRGVRFTIRAKTTLSKRAWCMCVYPSGSGFFLCTSDALAHRLVCTYRCGCVLVYIFISLLHRPDENALVNPMASPTGRRLLRRHSPIVHYKYVRPRYNYIHTGWFREYCGLSVLQA